MATKNYTARFYDAHPNSADCAWPTSFTIAAASDAAAIRRAALLLKALAGACGEYEQGDELWFDVRRAARIVATRAVTV